MSEVMNGYELLAPFQNKNAGFSRWTYAIKNGKEYFLKEFLNPVYPVDDSLSVGLRKMRISDCEEHEVKMTHLYEEVNKASDGNLVRINEFFRYDSHYYIATERVQPAGVKLSDISELPLEDKLLLCKTIAHSMMKLHEVHIVHSDIKGNNILMKRTATGKLVGKIIDFECSFFEEEPPMYEDELGGDQVYFSPEACQFVCGDSVRLTCKMDVFALGLLFHQYLTGELPGFNTEKYDYPCEAVLDGKKLKVSEELPEQLQVMLKNMLVEKMDKRISMAKVYEILQKMDPVPEEAPIVQFHETDDKSEKEKANKYFFYAGDM